ncbi:flagellar biosynthesis regulator FlaF [Cognatishimia activa]|uniref:Flagellar biosynthesis regulatory protein FlaF n=1 Tax=Cognatishimia activa TaxID=1715691 RepID=A0A0P1IQR4_9RHOB|nr:flagellar biosynthesis regulator FlaF [Cognatishimia activa]CUI98134.1 flagellar biosynthesis regulatory protein FlaF [Cognatishimia activa]CUK25922.1 flagellar biosynthesis regulatory protein FlaF [Cognatishimia activa]
MSIAAYKRTISETESPRQIERRVLSNVTAEMESKYLAFDQAATSGDRLALLAEGLRDTLWYNERIWMTMRNDLAENANALSPDLKAGLISLALWVETHTNGVLKGEKQIKPLLDINRSIIRGLEGNPMHVME